MLHFCLLQRDIALFYLGTRFIAYSIKPRMRLRQIAQRNVGICEVKSSDIEDTFFEAQTSDPYHTNYILLPLRQKFASALTESALKAWGIEIKKKDDVTIRTCDRAGHGEHEFLASI